MNFKCCTCNKDFKDDEIVYAPKSKKYYYFCFECYKKRKEYKEETFNIYLEQTKDRIKSKKEEQNLYSYLSSRYGYLDTRFFQKKSEINSGKFKTKQYNSEYSAFKISDIELLDMFVKMEKYLEGIVSGLKDKSQISHYVLTIVYNSYPKYLEHKKKIINLNPTHEVSKITDDKIKLGNIKTTNVDKLNLNEFIL